MTRAVPITRFTASPLRLVERLRCFPAAARQRLMAFVFCIALVSLMITTPRPDPLLGFMAILAIASGAGAFADRTAARGALHRTVRAATAMAFGVLVVAVLVAVSPWIMSDLDKDLMPGGAAMDLPMHSSLAATPKKGESRTPSDVR